MGETDLGTHDYLGAMTWRSPFVWFEQRVLDDTDVAVRLCYHQDTDTPPDRRSLDPLLDRYAEFLSDLAEREAAARRYLAANASPALGPLTMFQVMMDAGPTVTFAADSADDIEKRYAQTGPFSLYFRLGGVIAQEAMATSTISIAFDDQFVVLGWPVRNNDRFERLPEALPEGAFVQAVTHPWFGAIEGINHADLPTGDLDGHGFNRDLNVPAFHQHGFEPTVLDPLAKLDRDLPMIAARARRAITAALREHWIGERVDHAATDRDRAEVKAIFPNAFSEAINEDAFTAALWLQRVGYYPFAEGDRVMVMDFRILDPSIDDMILVAYVGTDGTILEVTTES